MGGKRCPLRYLLHWLCLAGVLLAGAPTAARAATAQPAAALPPLVYFDPDGRLVRLSAGVVHDITPGVTWPVESMPEGIAAAPVGPWIAFVVVRNDGPQLYLVNTASGQTKSWEPAALPRWSPDGVRLAYVKLPVVGTEGAGGPLHVVDVAKLAAGAADADRLLPVEAYTAYDWLGTDRLIMRTGDELVGFQLSSARSLPVKTGGQEPTPLACRDGQRLAVQQIVGRDAVLKLIDLKSGAAQDIGKFALPEDILNAAYFMLPLPLGSWSPQCDLLAFAPPGQAEVRAYEPASGKWRKLAGDAADLPIFSNDGRWLVYSSAGEIHVLEVASGKVETVAAGAAPRWIDDGLITIHPALRDGGHTYTVQYVATGAYRRADANLFFAATPDFFRAQGITGLAVLRDGVRVTDEEELRRVFLLYTAAYLLYEPSRLKASNLPDDFAKDLKKGLDSPSFWAQQPGALLKDRRNEIQQALRAMLTPQISLPAQEALLSTATGLVKQGKTPLEALDTVVELGQWDTSRQARDLAAELRAWTWDWRPLGVQVGSSDRLIDVGGRRIAWDGAVNVLTIAGQVMMATPLHQERADWLDTYTHAFSSGDGVLDAEQSAAVNAVWAESRSLRQEQFDILTAALRDQALDVNHLKPLSDNLIKWTINRAGLTTSVPFVVGRACVVVGAALTLGDIMFGLPDIYDNLRLAQRSHELHQAFKQGRLQAQSLAKAAGQAAYDGQLAENFRAAYLLEMLSAAQAQRSYADAAAHAGILALLWGPAADGLRKLALEDEQNAENYLGHPPFIDTAIQLARSTRLPGADQAPADDSQGSTQQPDTAAGMPRGEIAYLDPDGRIFLADLATNQSRALTAGGGYRYPVWSPDGRYLAYEGGQATDPTLYLLDMQTGQAKAWLPHACCATWSPAGDSVIFADLAARSLVSMQADGSKRRKLSPDVFVFGKGSRPHGPLDWSSDGQLYGTLEILVGAGSLGYHQEVRVMRVDPKTGRVGELDLPAIPNGDPEMLACFTHPAASPDGKSLAVTRDSTCAGFAPGGPTVMMRSTAGQWAELAGGPLSADLSWSPDGARVVFQSYAGCDQLGQDGPGFCGEGISVADPQGGAKRLVAKGGSQPAWRPGQTAAQKPVIDYFALGDSVASGHGLQGDDDACRRSPLAYPAKVTAALAITYTVRPHYLACSGARTVFDPDEKNPSKWFHNQVQEVLDNLPAGPTLVSITIGANDYEWSDPLKLLAHVAQPGKDYMDWADATKTEVAKYIKYEVRRLLAHPNVGVVITEYHNPFNPGSTLLGLQWDVKVLPCANVNGSVSCYERTSYAMNALNAAIVKDVWMGLGQPAHLQLADLGPDFARHASPKPYCGSADPKVGDTWVQYLGDAHSTSLLPAPLREPLRTLTGAPDEHGDCFHPNERGAQAYADRVVQAAQKIGLAQLATAPQSTGAPEASVAGGKVSLGGTVIFDAARDAPGCFDEASVIYAPTRSHFVVLVNCFEGDDEAFLFQADGKVRRQITAAGDLMAQGAFVWASDGRSLNYLRANACYRDRCADLPPLGLVQYDVGMGAKVLLVPGDTAYTRYRAAKADQGAALTVRVAPGTDQKPAGSLPAGIWILGQPVRAGGAAWVPIWSAGLRGWVDRSYLVQE